MRGEPRFANLALRWLSESNGWNGNSISIFPVGIFPLILERLRGTPARLYFICEPLTPEALTRQVNGGWSIQEHIGHLLDLEELHDGRIDDFLRNKPILRASDMTNKKTHEANHNRRDIRELLEAFSQARELFIERLEALDEDVMSRKSLHPRLNQPMRVVDMAYFTAEHDDQHLAIIREILDKI